MESGWVSSYPKNLQTDPSSGEELYSIDFSQSLTQILASSGQNLNTNPKEGFNVISECTDTWKETMTGWHNRQEERILSLEHQLNLVNNALQESQISFVNGHEAIIPKI